MFKSIIENRLLTIVLSVVFLAGYSLINVQTNFYEVPSQLDFGLFGSVTTFNTTIATVSASVVLIVNAFLTNYLFNHHNLYERTTYFPGFLYIVWLSFSKSSYVINGELLAHFFLLLIIHQLFLLNQNESGKRQVFNSGFLAGIVVCLHPTAALAPLFLLPMIWVHRPFVIRETLLTIIGLLLPIGYAAIYSLLCGTLFQPWSSWVVNSHFLKFSYVLALIVTVLAIIYFSLSFLAINQQLQKSSIRLRKQIRTLWIYFFYVMSIGIADAIFTQELHHFVVIFTILPFLSFYSFVKKPYLIFTHFLFLLVVILSFLKFFLS
jgi:hypothetical protein